MFNIHLAGIPEEYTRKKFIKEIVQKQRRNLKPKDKFPDEKAHQIYETHTHTHTHTHTETH